MSQSSRSPTPTSDPVGSFLRELPERGRMPWLVISTGRIGIDIREAGKSERWTLTVKQDHVDVSRVGGEADITLIGDREVFNEIVTGKSHAISAALRGVLIMHGERRDLLFVFQRLMPGLEPAQERQS